MAWFRLSLRDRVLAARILRDNAAARRLTSLGDGPSPVEVPERWRDADAVSLFRVAVAAEEHAQVRQAAVQRRAAAAQLLAGTAAHVAQGLRDLAATYRVHGHRQLTAADPTQPD